jgi:hypothetical protein
MGRTSARLGLGAGVAALLTAGCTGQDDDSGTFTHDFTSQHDTATNATTNPTTTDPVTTLPDGLNGVEPAQALPPPDFTMVVSRHGNLVSKQDLIGKPTVLWFYPAAFTGG